MNTFRHVLERSAVRNDLKQMVEPLANYICATEQPQRALRSALAVLLSEVESTNRAASSHFRVYLEN